MKQSVRSAAFIGALLIFSILFTGCGTTGSVPASEAAEAWYNLGNAYTDLGRHDDAVKAFTRARRLDPDLMQAGFNLARVLIIQKKYDESLVQLDELIERDPGNRLVRETKAWVYHLKGDDDSALGIYNDILEEYEDSKNALYNSALILSYTEDNVTALQRFKRLYNLYPQEESAVFEIARLEAAEGNWDEALFWAEKRISKYPDDLVAVELSGDMLSNQKKYADAVLTYRRITDSAASGNFSGDKDVGQEHSKDMLGRVYFKTAEILLRYMEDAEGGLEALRLSVETGWHDPEYSARLLSDSGAEWYKEASDLLKVESETAEDASAEDMDTIR